MMKRQEIHDRYWALMHERLASNAFARDVFTDRAVQPSQLRSAESYYRAVVWKIRQLAYDEGWQFPQSAEIAQDAPPYFELRQDENCSCGCGGCVLIERTGVRQ